ncbi:DNA-binding transcriptional regulator [Aquaspirillum sp. LM1]|uniref:helix-turn-helix transcriptional regulator n=1 Tax=Aquaspirillum sp. LM1 TaxID=1938604 RepID=UPI000983E9CC|nr:YafY family protein [Aquaspirillum sp. LM1]AQR66588.1 DNA-binding transcriptional regulator [Aquaspirillum sp. LM1]
MRRADRLYRLIESLRGRRCVTAAQLAQWLEVSERTVYRDVRDLMASGVPIEGEAGVGYRLARHYHLPPLMFNADELAALRLGAAMVGSWGDPALGQLASNALAKIDAVLPPSAARAPAARLFVPDLHDYPVARLTPLRQAIAARQCIELDYCRADGELSRRRVHPLGLFFWGVSWTLAAWCEARDEFRHFRIDRILACTPLADTFTPQAGRTLEDFFRSVGARTWPPGG